MTGSPGSFPSLQLLQAWRHPEFLRGAREMVPAGMGIAAWGLVTGIAMTRSGLGIPLAVAMSLLVYAGSAQLSSLPLISAGAPMWLVWATACCVNLRFVIFSAQWRPYFGHLPRGMRVFLGYCSGDLNYVIFMRRFPVHEPAPEQVPYFLGGAVLNWLAWQVPSMVGIFAADAIPPHWGVGFAGALALLGLIYAMATDRATWVSAGVAACAAVAAFALPFNMNIVVAIVTAVAIGLLIDHTAKTPVPLEEGT